MATDFTQESVLRFILRNEGNVRNSELLSYFKEFLREHEDRARNRELFKRYVNAVATVKQEDGVSYVVLRKKYRPHIDDISASTASSSHAGKRQDDDGQNKVGGFEHKSTQEEFFSPNTEHILPAVGIVNNNYINAVNLNQHVKTFEPNPWEERVSSIPRNKGSDNIPLNSQLSSGRGQGFEQPSKGLAETPGPKHATIKNAKLRQLQETSDLSQMAFSPPAYPNYVVSGTLPTKDVAHKHTDTFQSYDYTPSDAWPFPISLGQSQNSASSPCLTDIPAPLFSYTEVNMSDDIIKPDLYISEPEDYEKTASVPVSSALQKCGKPVEKANLPLASVYPERGHHKDLSSSQNSLSQASSLNSEGAGTRSQEYWSSESALNRLVGEQDHPGSEHFHEVELRSRLRSSEHQGTTWHHSTGHLLDKEPGPSITGSAPDNGHLKAVGRRLSHHLRSRMCRSLGADLDQAFREDADTARQKRLQRIKSFLNVGSVSSSRAHSPMGSLSPASSLHSLGHDNTMCGHRHIHGSLGPQEHEWFVKAATGSWSDIYSLFRDDPNLLAKRDFVSGYTVLHWIAKHGDHRVLNTLWYGVTKAGTTLDVNTRSSCGYTPLHLAAIHGHKNFIRLLVHKYKANIALRDNNGKRPWQYLARNNDQDLLDLLGAPKGKIGGNVGVQWHIDTPPVAPIIRSSGATVKRHSSLAVLFKHKSHLSLSHS